MLAASGGNLTLILTVLAVAAALVGAMTAIAKLGGERDSAAVSQAQSANEALSQTLEACERERDYWRNRYFDCARKNSQLVDALGLRDRLQDGDAGDT